MFLVIWIWTWSAFAGTNTIFFPAKHAKHAKIQFPDAVKTIEEKKKLKYYIYSNIANLPANEFLPLMNEIMEQTVDARTLIAAMYYDLCIMIDGEEVPEEEYNFRERMDDIMKKQAKAI